MEVLNNYIIKGEPLKGGMGQVFHLHNKYWKIDLAMKQPLEKYLKTNEQKEMFINECEKWMTLGVHPNIVQCYYVGEVDNKMSAFMEWMPAGTLKDLIAEGRIYKGDNRTRLLFILEIALQMAIGLRYAHSKGLLHLDIKPANVLMGENFNAKISDFGISNYLNQNVEKVLYTPLYCAPEQKNKQKLSKATDIYCYGVTLLHLICGDAVWHDGIVAGVAHNTILKNYSKIELPDEIQIVLDKCLELKAEKRFSSFDEIIDLLGKCWDKLNIGSIFKFYPEFYENVSNSINNIALSYYNLGNLDKAKNKWVYNIFRFKYHASSVYNLSLYNFIYGEQTQYYAFTKLYKYSDFQNKHYHQYLLSRFYLSTKAYEKAKRIASNATKKFQIIGTKLEYLDLYLNNEKYIQQRYDENGPKVLFEMNFKNILKVDSIEKDCAFLGMINNHDILYISNTGKLTRLYLKEKMYKNGNTGLNKVDRAVMTKNGQYLALCKIDDSLKKENKVYHEINIYDLKDTVIKIKLTIKGYYDPCVSLFFINQSNEYPTLIMKTKDEFFDFIIMDDSLEIENNEFDSNRYHFNSKLPLLNCAEVDGDFILGLTNQNMIIYDVNHSILSEKLNLEKVYPLSIQSCLNKPYVFMLNDKKGLAVYDTAKMKYIAIDGFENEIIKFAISPDGTKLCTLEGTQLKIRKMPDYSIEEKTLWEIAPFQSTKTMMENFNHAKKQEKLVHELLNEDLDDLKILTIKNAMMIVRTYLEYDRYLILCGLAAKKMGFKKLNTRQSFTDIDLEYYPMDKEGYFYEFDDLKIINCNDKVQLVDKNNQVLANLNCKFNEILGISKEYCDIVCAFNNNSRLKYKVIELEWII